MNSYERLSEPRSPLSEPRSPLSEPRSPLSEARSPLSEYTSATNIFTAGWLKVGRTLHSIDPDNFDLWREFSKRCYGFTEAKAKTAWINFVRSKPSTKTVIPEGKKPTRVQLLNICRERGIKKFYHLNKNDLCGILGIPIVDSGDNHLRAVPITLIDIDTRKETHFKSIYAASKFIAVNPGIIYMKKNTKSSQLSRITRKSYWIVTQV